MGREDARHLCLKAYTCFVLVGRFGLCHIFSCSLLVLVKTLYTRKTLAEKIQDML